MSQRNWYPETSITFPFVLTFGETLVQVAQAHLYKSIVRLCLTILYDQALKA